MADIYRDKVLQKYYRKRHLTSKTISTYNFIFSNYHRVTGLSPTTAIEQADMEEEEGVRLKHRKILSHLDDYEDHLESNYSENTLRLSMSVIRSFYRFHNIELPRSTRRPPNPTREESLVDLPSSSDIVKAMSFANIKYQAIIMLLASSGMRQGDLRCLTLGNLTEALKKYAKLSVNQLVDIGVIRDILPEKVGPLVWDIWMRKKSRYYTTFSTPESLDYILRYLESDPPKDYDKDTFLFRNNTVEDNPLTGRGLGHYFRLINKRSQFPSRKGFIYFRPHNLRKWFANQLKKTELGYVETRVLMGHRVLDDTGNRYIKPDYEDLYLKYYRNMDTVTLYGKVEVHDTTDERVETLQMEVEALKRQMARRDKLEKLP